jgi:hypothetical protein
MGQEKGKRVSVTFFLPFVDGSCLLVCPDWQETGAVSVIKRGVTLPQLVGDCEVTVALLRQGAGLVEAHGYVGHSYKVLTVMGK